MSEGSLIRQAFFQAVPHPTMVIDRTHGIVAANQAVLGTFNKTAEEIVGSKCYELFHDSDRPAPGCPMERLLSECFQGIVEMEAQTVNRTLVASSVPICTDPD